MIVQNSQTNTTEIEENISSVDTKVGETNDTGGSATSGSIMAKLNALLTNLANHMAAWTSARAGYIDAINTNASTAATKATVAASDAAANKTTLSTINTTLNTVNTNASTAATNSTATHTNGTVRTGADWAMQSWITANGNAINIGATNNTGGSTTAGTVMAKLNALLTSWTSTRAGYVDRLANSTYGLDKIKADTTTNNTASKTGVLSQKESYTHSLLENGTYGLNAIKTAITNSGGGTNHVSLTGTGTTIYSRTSAYTVYTGHGTDSYVCLAKFQAPVTGIYTITAASKSDTTKTINISAYRGAIYENFYQSQYNSGSGTGTTYTNSGTACMYDIGKSLYDAVTVNTRVSSDEDASPRPLYGITNTLKNILTVPASGGSASNQFWCEAGRYVTIFQVASNDGKSRYIASLSITYQNR